MVKAVSRGLYCFKCLMACCATSSSFFAALHHAHHTETDDPSDNWFCDVVLFHLLLDIYNYVLERVATGHLLLKLLLELLPGTDGPPVPDGLGQLLQARLREVFHTLLIGRKKFPQPVIRADFVKARGHHTDVLLIDPGLEELHSERG